MMPSDIFHHLTDTAAEEAPQDCSRNGCGGCRAGTTSVPRAAPGLAPPASVLLAQRPIALCTTSCNQPNETPCNGGCCSGGPFSGGDLRARHRGHGVREHG